jgi:diguanylate cyclase (GGDEF)-like protein
MEGSADSKKPYSLIMVDVDHFKLVNDRYGHHIGDVVLQRVAELFKEAVRDHHGAIAGRWGGEEFFLVLPEIGSDDAMELAEGLRKNVERQDFTEVGKVTISLGVITPPEGMDPRSIFSDVDDALYKAKEGGRNRIVKAGSK